MGVQQGEKMGRKKGRRGREAQIDERRVGGEEAGDKKKGWTNMHGGRGEGMAVERERERETSYKRGQSIHGVRKGKFRGRKTSEELIRIHHYAGNQ